MSGQHQLQVDRLGRVPYPEALELQIEWVEARRQGASGDRLVLLEHPAVITLGRSTQPENLLLDPAELARRGIARHEISRGGDVTYHAPGQLVGYLISDLTARGAPDLHRFLREMEGALIDALASLGVAARRVEGRTGVFMADRVGPDRKIASIGIGVRHWITYHGFGLNVSVDLGGFDAIVPCGLADVEMTSLERELERLGEASSSAEVLDRRARDAVEAAFVTRFS